MIALHVCWKERTSLRASGADNMGFDGYFFLWGEGTTPSDRRSFRGRPRKNYPKKHPWQVEVSDIQDKISELSSLLELEMDFQNQSQDQDQDQDQEASEILFLPTSDKNGLPFPSSPWIIEDKEEEEKDDKKIPKGSSTLRPWEVWGIQIPLRYAMKLFSSDLETIREFFHPGKEIRYLGEVIRFVHSLVERQRFIPSLYRGSELESRWRPLFVLPDDKERFEQLISTVPACLFAPVREEKNPFENRDKSSRSFLEELIQSFVDREVREGLSEGGWNRSFRGVDKQTPGIDWLIKLGDKDDPSLDLSDREAQRLIHSYQSWIRSLNSVGTSDLRTGFKLVPPNEKDDGAVLFTAEKGWNLDFFLESVGDESFHIDAGELWSREESSLKPLEERYDSPQETLLTDLGIASRLFDPLKTSLKEKEPAGCALSTKEAHRFLKEGYWLLKEAGFMTKVPSWWDPDSLESDEGLGLKAVISSSENQTSFPSSGLGKSMGGWDTVLNFDWKLAIGDADIPPEEFEKLKSLKSSLVKVHNRWIELDPESVQKTLDFFGSSGGKELTPKEVAGKVLEDSSEAPLPVMDLEVQNENESDTGGGELFFPERKEMIEDPPDGFHGDLWAYQKSGVNWLLSLMNKGFSPCLADDMGLGKTIQFLAALKEIDNRSSGEDSKEKNPSLLICPTSVLGNWSRETERFVPSVDHLLYHGQDRPGEKEFFDTVSESDLVITSYGLLRNDFSLLRKVEWKIVALDEIQKIKNPKTKTARCARDLPGDIRVGLTGTPIENNLTELWSIMEFLNPSYLGPKTKFQKKYAKPIQRYESERKERILKKLVNPLILRRKKTDPNILTDLPEKTEKKEYCSLTSEQASLYQAVVEEAGKKLEKAEAEAETKENSGSMKKRGCILATIGKLKQICNHPAHYLGEDHLDPERSGKTKRLVELCQTVVAEGYSALLFTQYVKFGEMLRTFLQENFHYHVPFLQGKTPQKKRDRMIKEFQGQGQGQDQEERVPFFLISLRAGGHGINLTEASHVIHVDRWWNPAVESQASDRAHRIGQDKNVTVHKFISSGTYEESIDEMIESKKELAERIVDSGEKGLTELSKEEFLDVIELKEGVEA